MRLVVDTNVWIAGLVAEGLCRDIVKRLLSSHDLITSAQLMDELVEKLSAKFQLDAGKLPILQSYLARAILVIPARLQSPICRDPDDDWVLATATAGEAETILTGDKDLLTLRSYQNIPILSPRQFIEKLEE